MEEENDANVWTIDRAMAAIAAGDLDVLEEWIQNTKPCSAIVDDLMQQCLREQQDHLFSSLLQAGATPSKFVDARQYSPLYTVLRKNKGDISTLQLILDNVKASRMKVYVNKKDRRGYTPLYMACKNGYTECARMLVERGAKVNSPSSYDGLVPLMAASEKGHLEIIKFLFENGALVNKHTNLGDSALCWAAKSSHVSCVRVLLQAGADVNAISKCGESALMSAVKTSGTNTLDCVKELLSAGVDVTLKDWRSQTALWYATNYSTQEVALFLADRLHEAGSSDVDLSLLVAVERDHSKLVQHLLLNGWSVKCRDKYGRNLLHIAAERGVTECLAYILQSEYMHLLDINETAGRFFELSPLHLAIRWCHPKAVEMFLDHGADPDWRDRHHASPLISCMSTSELRCRSTLAKILMRHGCDIHAMVNPKVVQPWGHEELHQGQESLRTALEWAVCLRELWLARMLWAAGVKAGPVATWTEATLPWQDAQIYPEEEYTTTASKKDVLCFIQNVVCQPRCLAEICRSAIRVLLPRPIHRSIVSLPLPFNVKDFLNIEEWDDIEKENLKEDECIREKLNRESDEDFCLESSSSGTEDSS